MSKLFELAVEKARALPDEEQDALAAMLLSMTDETARAVAPLDEETRTAIREGLEQARRGEFVPDAEIDALWNRHGL